MYSQNLITVLFYRHEELIANNDMYARMWFEQRKSKSKLFEQW